MDEVIKNDHVFNIWKHIIAGRDADVNNDPYYTIVKAQHEVIANYPLDPQIEGYQVGSPWHGNLTNARVMFLSSNPAITPTCYYPRYHGDDRYTLYGDKKIIHDIANHNPPCNREDAKRFIENRFNHTPFTYTGAAPNDPRWSVYMLDAAGNAIIKGRGGVMFWNNLWKTAADLLGDGIQRACTEQGKRDSLQNVVSAEIVPFLSMNEAGVGEVLEDCWDRYTMHVLANCPARVIFLVGRRVMRLFCRIINDPAIQHTFNNREYVDINLAGRIRKVAWLRHFSNGWTERMHLPSNWFAPNVLQALRN